MSLEDTLFTPTPIVWGIFGHTNTISEQELQERTLMPLLQELGRTPDKVLLPSEGNSSIYLQEWAESLHIKTQVFHCDWAKNGRIAQFIRDDRIQKECTHALVFLSPKSERLGKYAEKLVRKGKVVVTSLDGLQRLPSASAPARKSDTGIMQRFRKCQC